MLKRIIAFIAMIVACVVTVAGASAPAAAQNTKDTVELTFRLEVEGDVPGWQRFAVEYYPAGGQPGTLPLCTTADDEGPAGPRCEDGNVYTASAEVPAGNTVTYRFLRHDTRTAPEYFEAASGVFDLDSSVTASYIFPGGAPGEIEDAPAAHDQYDDGGVTPNAPDDLFSETEMTMNDAVETENAPIAMLPDTGGAGTALALGLTLIVLGGFAFRRSF